MRFVPVVTEKQFAIAEHVIAPYEKFCVSLADRVRLRDKDVFLLVPDEDDTDRVSRFFGKIFSDVKNACGVIYLRNTLFHCLPFMYSSSAISDLLCVEFIKSLPDFLRGKTVSCISGTKNESEIFLNALAKGGKKPALIYDYMLMSFPKNKINPGDNKKPSVSIQRGRASECDEFFKLQENYLLEEVIPPCRTYNAAVSRYEFSYTLRTRVEIIVKNSNGKVVAKGGIHSEGQHHAQIGGVYTLTEERGKGFAQNVVAVLVAEILRQKKKPVLFVKKANAPAISVYKKIGFVPECDYMIVYY